MIKIELGQEVYENQDYITCESGEFDPYDLVKCKKKNEVECNTCAFLASQIINSNDESSLRTDL